MRATLALVALVLSLVPVPARASTIITDGRFTADFSLGICWLDAVAPAGPCYYSPDGFAPMPAAPTISLLRSDLTLTVTFRPFLPPPPIYPVMQTSVEATFTGTSQTLGAISGTLAGIATFASVPPYWSTISLWRLQMDVLPGEGSAPPAGLVVEPTGTLIPEPTTFLLVVSLLPAVVRRRRR